MDANVLVERVTKDRSSSLPSVFKCLFKLGRHLIFIEELRLVREFFGKIPR